jgi:hypothetical protein
VTAKFYLELIAIPLLLLLAMGFFVEMGVRIRRRHQASGVLETDGLGVVDGAVFGLMGLLLAFAFSGAASRFDARRHLVVQETNDIGTAWLRLDLLPAADRAVLQQKFRDYLDSRLETYQDMTDEVRVRSWLAKTEQIQREIWDLAVTSTSKSPTTTSAMLLLPALNAMFDTATLRTGSLQMHAPAAVFFLLIVVLALCSILAGYRVGISAQWSRLHRASFVLILAVTYYVIIDLEYPRVGLIRVDSIDDLLRQLRASMG